MINELSIQAVKQALFRDNKLCRPLYKTYCFSKIPATIDFLFTGKDEQSALPLDTVGGSFFDAEVVILILLDGFGWRFFEQYQQRYPFLQKWLKQGICSKITAQFPSTTAAQITSLHTGLEVGISGVYEWFYYEPVVDAIIAPLLTSFAGDKKIGTLCDAGVDTTLLYPGATLYEKLQKKGIDAYLIQPANIAHSPYSKVVCKGAHIAPYQELGDGLDGLLKLAKNTPQGDKRYIFLYFGDIDGAAHHHGLFSKPHEDAVHKALTLLDQKLGAYVLKEMGKRGALIVTADHGMIEVDPKTTCYINETMPELTALIKKNQKNKPIVPAGSCRDLFLHFDEEHCDRAEALLLKHFEHTAWVVRTKKLIEEQFFGTTAPSKEFLSRVGDLVILPNGHGSVWWHEAHRFSQTFFASHGGLSREEMETIFLFERFG